MSDPSQHRSMSISWIVLLAVLLAFEASFLWGACVSGVAGLERVFSIFTGLILITFGAILYAGRLIFYD